MSLFRPHHVKGVAILLRQQRSPGYVSFRFSTVDDAAVDVLAAEIPANTTLKKLDFEKCQLTEVGFRTLLGALGGTNKTLTDLLLHGNNIGDGAAEILEQWLSSGSSDGLFSVSLRVLDLGGNP
eukprot:RCo005740